MMVMELWRDCFRRGVAPVLSTDELMALRDGLARDDERICQTFNTLPVSDLAAHEPDLPIEAACPLAYAIWQGQRLPDLAGVVESELGQLCLLLDQRTGEAGAVRHLTNWIDSTPREEMRAALLAEVELALAGRRPVVECAG
jgi:hypothetical protein